MFFTADTHFGHKSVIKYSNRPYKYVEEMDEALINNWNAVVGPADVVWHIGDFAFAKHKRIIEILEQLNGRKNLVLGNHDHIIEACPERFTGPGLFESIQHAKVLRLKQTYYLHHYSCRTWAKSHYGSCMLYGHSHGSSRPWGRSLDVGVDSKEISEEYRPYSLQ